DGQRAGETEADRRALGPRDARGGATAAGLRDPQLPARELQPARVVEAARHHLHALLSCDGWCRDGQRDRDGADGRAGEADDGTHPDLLRNVDDPTLVTDATLAVNAPGPDRPADAARALAVPALSAVARSRRCAGNGPDLRSSANEDHGWAEVPLVLA